MSGIATLALLVSFLLLLTPGDRTLYRSGAFRAREAGGI
jgi:hypothetical protein